MRKFIGLVSLVCLVAVMPAQVKQAKLFPYNYSTNVRPGDVRIVPVAQMFE